MFLAHLLCPALRHSISRTRSRSTGQLDLALEIIWSDTETAREREREKKNTLDKNKKNNGNMKDSVTPFNSCSAHPRSSCRMSLWLNYFIIKLYEPNDERVDRCCCCFAASFSIFMCEQSAHTEQQIDRCVYNNFQYAHSGSGRLCIFFFFNNMTMACSMYTNSERRCARSGRWRYEHG